MDSDAASEAATYAEDLRLALDALNGPDKLQINTLTDLVRENPQFAEQSVQAIKQRILTAPVAPMNEVLPAIYLLDSVVKNVGGPFVALFENGLYDLFFGAFYRMSNGRTRLVHVLETWKTMGTFSAELVGKIWAALPPPPAGAAAAAAAAPAPSDAPDVSLPKRAATTAVEADGNRKRAHVAPAPLASLDAVVQQQETEVLQSWQAMWSDLQKQVATQGYPVTAEQQAMFAQLEEMRRDLMRSQRPAPSAAAAVAPAPASVPAFTQPVVVGGMSIAPQTATSLLQAMLSSGLLSPQLVGGVVQQPPPSVMQQQQQLPRHHLPAPLHQQHQQHQQQPLAGRGSAAVSRPPGRGVKSYLPPVNERHHVAPKERGHSRSLPGGPSAPHHHGRSTAGGADEWGVGFSRVAQLEFKDLHVYSVRAMEQLYAGAGKACATCGLRFTVKDKYLAHVDWHFKHNSREKSRAARLQSRAWFSKSGAWHNDTGGDAAQVATAGNPFGDAAGGHATDATSPAVAASSVGRTPSRVHANEEQPDCAICKEPFTRLWVDEEDAWMYDEALQHGSSLVHQDCFSAASEAAKAAL